MKIPYIFFESWFLPKVKSEDEAEDRLNRHSAGTFLVRFSSKVHALTISKVIEETVSIMNEKTKQLDEKVERRIVHVRIQQTGDGHFSLPGRENKFSNLIDLIQSESKTTLLTPCPTLPGTHPPIFIKKGYIYQETVSASHINSPPFVLSECLSSLSGGETPESIFKKLEVWKNSLLKDCKGENFSHDQDKTFWLGQTVKYMNLIDKHIKEKHELPSPTCRICQILSEKVDVGDLS